jgi:hypothetical protein
MTAVFWVASVTGLATYWGEALTVWKQWTVLAHVVSGLGLAALSAPYLIFHFRRTLGYRRPTAIISGLAALIVLLALIASGLHIVIAGQSERGRWVYHWHVYAAFVVLALVAVHICVHWWFFPESRRKRRQGRFPSVTAPLRRYSIRLVTIGFVSILGLTAVYGFLSVDYRTTPVVDNYRYDYGSHPFRPSQTETYHGKFIDRRQIAVSDDCAACHSDIAAQWRSSAHRQAASDITYVRNISLLVENQGISAARYCEGCHAPVALLTGQLSPGGRHAGIAGTPANREGVGCLGCHGINRVVHLKGVASYEYAPPQDYLFAGYDAWPVRRLRHWLIQWMPDQHRRDMTRKPLNDPQVCATCHTQFMDKDMNDWGWVKMQDEYGAWLRSPYSGQQDQTFAHAQVKRCQDCHMPPVAAADPSADARGKVASHRALGANTMLPLVDGDREQLRLTKEFLKSRKMSVSIEAPNRKDASQTQRALDEALRADIEAPYYYYLGETAELEVVVSNLGVGHDFPGGTLDINEAWINFTVTDASGRLVYQSGYIRDDHSVDPGAYFYRSRPVDRNGNLVWKHDLFNRVGEAYKRVVPAGQSDVTGYRFAVPDWAENPLVAVATLKYRKLNSRYARWAMQEDYEPLPVVDMARTSLVIPVKEKPELEYGAKHLSGNLGKGGSAQSQSVE